MESRDKVKVLIGAQVDYVRVSYQIDIHMHGGTNRNENEEANLQIETLFSLKTDTETLDIDPEKTNTVAPVLDLFTAKVTDIELTEKYTLTLKFDNGYELSITPDRQYESWSLTGTTIKNLFASPHVYNEDSGK